MLHTALVISAYMSMIFIPCACAQWGDVLTSEWRTMRREFRLDMIESTHELGVRGPERRLRIDTQLARKVGADEEHVAELFARLLQVAGRHLSLQLGDLSRRQLAPRPARPLGSQRRPGRLQPAPAQ